jgi:histidine triad (HIT) family protein
MASFLNAEKILKMEGGASAPAGARLGFPLRKPNSVPLSARRGGAGGGSGAGFRLEKNSAPPVSACGKGLRHLTSPLQIGIPFGRIPEFSLQRSNLPPPEKPMTSAPYDQNNPFAKILRGELPCTKVYEDSRTFAFMDIAPRADGHTLIIPKAPCRNILDVPPEDLAATILIAQRIARAAKQAFAADGITLHQFSEAAGGQEVFHLHFHVLPRKAGVPLRPAGIRGDMEQIAQHAEMLKQALASG